MFSVTLEQFEGPLDLLLHLIEEEELDITEVSLARVADQYLERLTAFSSEHVLDELADFIVIAAKLLLIKSRALLPSISPQEEEESEDLQRQLKMYQLFHRASKNLEVLARKNRVAFPRRAPLMPIEGFVPPESITLSVLHDTFEKIIRSVKPIVQKTREVVFAPRVGIREKIQEIVSLLSQRAQYRFAEILGDAPVKADIVVSFMALLELIKQRSVVASQSDLFHDIVITRHDSVIPAHDQRGNTIIEVIVGFFVITVGLLGALSLATSNLRTQGVTMSRLVAVNLAREGVETARNIRDSNWLAQRPWNTGLVDGDGATRCAVIQSPRVSAFDFIPCPNTSDGNFFTESYRLYRSTDATTNDEYIQQGDSDAPTGVSTTFYRKVQIDPICLDAAEKEVLEGCTNDTTRAYRVSSDVSWQQGGKNYSAHLRENLYNWR